MTQKTDTDFARALALSLNQVLPIAKRAAQADGVANANANLSLLNDGGESEESKARRAELDKSVEAHRADTQRIQRASQVLQQFDQTENHVRDLPEDHFDGSFEVKFED